MTDNARDGNPEGDGWGDFLDQCGEAYAAEEKARQSIRGGTRPYKGSCEGCPYPDTCSYNRRCTFRSSLRKTPEDVWGSVYLQERGEGSCCARARAEEREACAETVIKLNPTEGMRPDGPTLHLAAAAIRGRSND